MYREEERIAEEERKVIARKNEAEKKLTATLKAEKEAAEAKAKKLEEERVKREQMV